MEELYNSSAMLGSLVVFFSAFVGGDELFLNTYVTEKVNLLELLQPGQGTLLAL